MASTLLHGPPGHPLRPPLRDVGIGAVAIAVSRYVAYRGPKGEA